MMEFVDPSFVPFVHMAAQEKQSQAPVDWNGINGQIDGMYDNNLVQGQYMPTQEDYVTGNGTYETGVENYGWDIDNAFKGQAVATSEIQQAGGMSGLYETKAIIQSTVTTVEVDVPTTCPNNAQQNVFSATYDLPAQELDDTQSHGRNTSWDGQQYLGPMEVSSNLAQPQQDLDTILNEMLQCQPSTLEYQPQHTSSAEGLAISNLAFRTEDFMAQPLLDDELPQLVYAQTTAAPSLCGSANPDTGDWSTPLRNNGNDLELDAEDGVSEIERLMFSDQDRLPALLPSAQMDNGAQTSLPLPMRNYHGMSSREGSIANPGTPRTPQTWNTNRFTSSPNPQIASMSDPIGDSLYSQIVTNTFPQIIGCAPPPITNMMNNFESKMEAESRKRKRKQYNAEDKVKVNLVRDNGACVACHARKVSCTPDGTCPGCIKVAADNPQLALQICVRTKLKDTYIGVKDIHNTLDIREHRIRPLLASLDGPAQRVNLTVANHRLGYQFRLPLEVKACASSRRCRWKRLAKVNGIYVTKDTIEAQRFVIVESSLPSWDEYDNFGRQILATRNGSHSGTLTQRLDEFLIGYIQYCHDPSSLLLRQFANSTLRVASLSRLVAYGFLNIYDGSYELLDRHTGSPITEDSATRRYVSETVHDQLRILAAKGLEPEEEKVFGQIDNLNKAFSKIKNGKIVSGICVLRLMLLYRDRVVRDTIRMGLPRSGEQHNIRRAKAEFMYRRLTLAYHTLCRDLTPLLMRWEAEEEIFQTNQERQTMFGLFSSLQPAFEKFCNEKVSNEYDGLFQELILAATKVEKKPVGKKRKVEKKKE